MDTITYYTNVTEEESETLQYYYWKEKYMIGHHRIQASTYTVADTIVETRISEDLVFMMKNQMLKRRPLAENLLNDMPENLSEEEGKVVISSLNSVKNVFGLKFVA